MTGAPKPFIPISLKHRSLADAEIKRIKLPTGKSARSVSAPSG
jgi:hypothetical protein